jgi:DNA-binding CsgD family transcriptional regulator
LDLKAIEPMSALSEMPHVDGLYTAMLNAAKWPASLELVRNAFSADVAWLMNPIPQLVDEAAAAPLVVSAPKLDVATLSLRDDAFLRFLLCDAPEVFFEEEHAGRDRKRGEVDGVDLSLRFGITAKTPSGATIVLALARCEGRAHARLRDAERLVSLQEHLARAIRVAACSRVRGELEIPSPAGLERLKIPAAFFDMRGVVTAANALMTGSVDLGVTVEHGRFVSGLPDVQQRFEREFSLLVGSESADPLQKSFSLRVPLSGRDILVHCSSRPRRSDSHPVWQAASPDSVALLAIALLEGASRDILPSLEALGLTHQEARLTALAAEGRGMDEIAEASSITVATARVHLKHIYRKLGLSGRAHLVSFTNQLV